MRKRRNWIEPSALRTEVGEAYKDRSLGVLDICEMYGISGGMLAQIVDREGIPRRRATIQGLVKAKIGTLSDGFQPVVLLTESSVDSELEKASRYVKDLQKRKAEIDFKNSKEAIRVVLGPEEDSIMVYGVSKYFVHHHAGMTKIRSFIDENLPQVR